MAANPARQPAGVPLSQRPKRRQLLASLEADLYPSIGGWRGLYPTPFPDPGIPAA